MRPKKLILVLDPDPTQMGIVMFTLSVSGFRVVGAHTIELANKIGEEHHIDAVLVHHPIEHKCSVPVVVAGKFDTKAIVEALRQATALKRGPKKQPKKEVDSSALLQKTGIASMK